MGWFFWILLGLIAVSCLILFKVCVRLGERVRERDKKILLLQNAVNQVIEGAVRSAEKVRFERFGKAQMINYVVHELYDSSGQLAGWEYAVVEGLRATGVKLFKIKYETVRENVVVLDLHGGHPGKTFVLSYDNFYNAVSTIEEFITNSLYRKNA